MAITLQDYLNDVQRLLHDATNRFWSVQELTDYINKARKLTVAETGCTRRMAPVNVSLVQPWAKSTGFPLNAIIYPSQMNGFYYKATVAGTSAATEPVWPTTEALTVVDDGVTWTAFQGNPGEVRMSDIVPGRTVIDVLDIMLQYSSNTAYQLRYLGFSDVLRSPVYQYQMTGTPQFYTIHNRSVIILQWPAMSYPGSLFDCVLEPLSLSATTDPENDIYFPYSEMVQFYACYLAKMKDQSRQEAEQFLNDYQRRKMQALGASFTRRLPRM